jgi:hypothetical protein
LGEYSSMFLLSAVTSIMFFSGTSENNSLILFFSITFSILAYNYVSTVYKLDPYYNEIFAIKLRFWEKTNYILKEYQLNIIYFFLSYVFIYIYLYLMYGNVLVISNFFNNTINIIYSLICFITLPIIYLPFTVKVVIISFFFILVRANVPRYRFDQLLGLSWKGLLPVSISSLVITLSLLFCFNGFISIL